MYLISYLTLLILLTSCVSPLEKGQVNLALTNVESKKLPEVINVTLSNDELKITGSNFKNLKSVKIDSQNLSITSNTENEIILSASSQILLALNSALNLIVETAAGATTVAVTFNLVDGSVTASKIGDGEIGANHLSQMGAGVGQVMQWNGTTWVPADLSGLIYLGAWDATQTGVGPDAGSGSVAGEYYVVSNPGSVSVDGHSSWSAGDWVVWNGSVWDKIDNSTGVTTFNGRTGTVLPQAGDYNLSMLGDVDTTGIAANKILKYDGTKWIISDDLSSGGAGSVSSTEILDGTISSTDLDSSLNTTLSKVSSNESNITTNTSDIATNASDITNLSTSLTTTNSNVSTNATNISTNTTDIASLTSSKVDKTITVNGQALNANVVLDSDDISEGVLNLYYTNARAKAATVVNSTAGTETDQAASVAAMKSFVTSQTPSLAGLVKADGSVAMTAALESSSAGIKLRDGDANFVTIKSNANIASDYNFILPTTAGTNGYVLATDGAGNLSWISPTTGNVTSIGVAAPLSSSGGQTPTLSISQASTTTNGYLSSTDWNTFNNKVSSTTTINGQALSSNVTLTTTNVAEGTNLYFTDTRAKTAAVVNSMAGTQTDQAPSVSAIKTYVDSADNLKVDKTITVNGQALSSNVTLTTTNVAEGTNLYFTDARAKSSAVVNSTAGSETTQAASVSSMKSYVSSEIATGIAGVNQSQWTTSGSNIYYSTGNVGILNPSPSVPLDVSGRVKFATAFANVLSVRGLGTTYSDSTDGIATFHSEVTSAAGGNVLKADSAYSGNTLVVKDNGRVGIGTASPVDTFEVVGGAKITGNLSFGSEYNQILFPENLGFSGGITGDDGSYKGLTLFHGHSIKFETGSNTIGVANERMRIDSTGNVGIGTTAPSDKLHVAGNVLAAAYLYTSDKRFKKNIETIDDPLLKVMALNGVYFDWRVEEFPERGFPEERTMGFIAQEVEQVAPELVKTAADGYKSVQYGNITALLVEAIKSISQKISNLFSDDEKLKREISSLKEENEKMKQELEEIKKSLNELKLKK